MFTRITPVAVTSNAAVVTEMSAHLPKLLRQRQINVSRLSGYPRGLHSIGALQQLIKLDSMKELLESLQRIQMIMELTAQVIESMDGVKIDRHQLDRTAIETYVKQLVTASRLSIVLSDVDYDLISFLIVSFEANKEAWVLDTDTVAFPMHQKFLALYKEVLTGLPGSELPYLVPSTMQISTFSLRLKKTVKSEAKKKSSGSGGPNESSEVGENPAGILSHRLALTRIIDHVYSLLLSTDLWYSFVAPRTRADVSTSLERAASLRTFAFYLRSLLIYPEFFALEAYLDTYERIQKWLTYFPPIPDHVSKQLENIVRSNDVLHARQDVREMFTSFAALGETEHMITLAQEMLEDFGLVRAIETAASAVSAATPSGSLADLKALGKREYIPLVAGAAVSSFNALPTLTALVVLSESVSKQITLAVANLIPALAKGVDEKSIDRLMRLVLVPKLPFTIPCAVTARITKGSLKYADSSALVMDTAAPSFTEAYHAYIRKEASLSLISDATLLTTYAAKEVEMAVDRSRAAALREILNKQWQTMLPIQLAAGNEVMSSRSVSASFRTVRSLLERLTGVSYEVLMRQSTLPHVQKDLATVFSGFCLLYLDQDSAFSLLTSEADMTVDPSVLPRLQLIVGAGKPYGKDYVGLQTIQTADEKDRPYIKLGNGLFCRFHDTLPTVTDSLVTTDNIFMLQHPHNYFSADGETFQVSEFVLAEGLSNFALFPLPSPVPLPVTKLTLGYAYPLTGIFVNTDQFYAPLMGDKGREEYALAVLKKDWHRDRTGYYTEYITFGAYGVTTNSLDSTTALEQTEAADTSIAQSMMVLEEMMDKSAVEQNHAEEVVAKQGPAVLADKGVQTLATELHKEKHSATVEQKPLIDQGKKKKKEEL